MKSGMIFLGSVAVLMLSGCASENKIMKKNTTQLPYGYMLVSGFSYDSFYDEAGTVAEKGKMNYDRATPGFFVKKGFCKYVWLKSYASETDGDEWVGFIKSGETRNTNIDVELYGKKLDDAHQICVDTDDFGVSTLYVGDGELVKNYENGGKHEVELGAALIEAQNIAINEINKL